MQTHRNGVTFTNMEQLMESVYQLLNERNIGNGPDDPPVAILIQTTGKYTDEEAEMKVTVFEGFISDEEIAIELGLVVAETDKPVVVKEIPVKGGWGKGVKK